jgi:hypothetical protein
MVDKFNKEQSTPLGTLRVTLWNVRFPVLFMRKRNVTFMLYLLNILIYLSPCR